MTPNELQQAGQALYGDHWQSPLARALDMSERHMRRLAAGQSPVTDGIADDIRRLLRERQKAIAALLK